MIYTWFNPITLRNLPFFPQEHRVDWQAIFGHLPKVLLSQPFGRCSIYCSALLELWYRAATVTKFSMTSEIRITKDHFVNYNIWVAAKIQIQISRLSANFLAESGLHSDLVQENCLVSDQIMKYQGIIIDF